MAATTGNQTEKGEETATVLWWPDLLDAGCLMSCSSHRQLDIWVRQRDSGLGNPDDHNRLRVQRTRTRAEDHT